jgi:iron complex transport system ATP-binding protein
LHDLNLAGEYCGRLLLLADGRVAGAGTPEEVLTAANIQRVYHATVWVGRNPVSQKPHVILIP